MNRKLKMLGIAFVASLALIAVMAPAAPAFFTSSAANTTLTGTKTADHVWTTGSGVGAMTCEVAHFHSTIGTQASTVAIKPIYGPTCKDSLGRIIHVVTSTLEFDLNTPVSGAGTMTLTGDIQTTVTSSATGATICTMTTSGPQTINGITYKNLGGTSGVEITTHSNNITSSISGGFFNCGTSATHSSTGEYKGTTIYTGETAGKKAEIKVD